MKCVSFFVIVAALAFAKGICYCIEQARNPPRLTPAQRRAACEHYKRMGQ